MANLGSEVHPHLLNLEFVVEEIFREYEDAYDSLSAMGIEDIEITTKCVRPCAYQHYQFISEPVPSSFKTDNLFVGLWSVSKKTYTEKEELIYPLRSLVAEFGGTLGLFLGFSFMTLWDGVEFALKASNKFISFFK